MCLLLLALEQVSQPPPRRGDDIVGADPEVLATVLQDGVAVLAQIAGQDADDLRRGGPRVDPHGGLVVLEPGPVAKMVTSIPAGNVGHAEPRVELDSAVAVRHSVREAPLGGADAGTQVVDRG